jgi:hypothetical protein
MIDPATGWFEIKDTPCVKTADVVENLVEQTWLTQHPPWPQEVLVLDQGTDFITEFSKMTQEDHGVKKKPMNKLNPQGAQQKNAVIKLSETCCEHSLCKRFSERRGRSMEWNPLSNSICSKVCSACHDTINTNVQMQPVFGHDAMFNIQHYSNWKHIHEQKQKITRINDMKESVERLPHVNTLGDLVLIEADQKSNHDSNACQGPFPVVRVDDNGTV